MAAASRAGAPGYGPIGAERPQQQRRDRVSVDSATVEHDHQLLVRHYGDALPAASNGFVNRGRPGGVDPPAVAVADAIAHAHAWRCGLPHPGLGDDPASLPGAAVPIELTNFGEIVWKQVQVAPAVRSAVTVRGP